MTAELQRAGRFFAVPFFGLLSFVPPVTGAAQAAERPTVWVEVVTHTDTAEPQLIDALTVRLPDRSVRSLPAGEFGAGCPDAKENDTRVVLHVDPDGGGALTVRSCRDGTVLYEDKIATSADSADFYRRAAVTAATALDGSGGAPPNREKGNTTEISGAPPEQPPAPFAPAMPDRTVAGISLSPGAAFTFTGNTLFRGTVAVGARFRSGLGAFVAADFSSRVRGSAVKKNETPDEGVEIGVTDFGFRLGLFYRHPFANAWFFEVGGGVGYTHSRIEDLSDEKYEITVATPAARGMGFVHAALGRKLSPRFSLDLRVTPTVSFGERRYTVRGEEALSMGYGSVTLGIGAAIAL